ncbi:MAG: hypothetical protein KJ556_02035 [Gammaproteobacteria bacterium]|nr:hypothetical protein [Gammaproteobacteria bacterium]MBU2058049.1 hypothetical protein [Gammaproteobacteria bacterium]MBU2173887.1 hypothetical protein [Gammaproteobacteria bacterium]MBU2245216.1 hypothetical protein [Gammaproteobacteria bacterium]MBU2343923.1 hypothetical protein [Gammaproteobacteria bacterium]
MTDKQNTAKDQTSQDDLMSELLHQSCDQALQRMKKHVDKTRSSFAKMLKLLNKRFCRSQLFLKLLETSTGSARFAKNPALTSRNITLYLY